MEDGKCKTRAMLQWERSVAKRESSFQQVCVVSMFLGVRARVRRPCSHHVHPPPVVLSASHDFSSE